MDRNLTFAKMM